MKVAAVMSSPVQMVDPETDLVTAAGLMKEFNIGCLLVGSSGHLAGVVTDRDIVLRAVTSGNHYADITVAEVMTRDPMFCVADDDIVQAARIMQECHVRRLPVLGADRTVVGIVSWSDLCTNPPGNIVYIGSGTRRS